MKKILIILGLLVIVAISVFFLLGKEEKMPTHVKINPGFSEYVDSYTSGIISSESKIKIRLSGQFKQDVESGVPVKNNVFSFEPEIKGKITWLDNRTLIFNPEESLKSGQRYKGTFHLGKLIDVPKEFAEFPIQIQIIKQAVRISKISFSPYKPTELKYNALKGELATSDVIDNQIVEKMMKAELEDNRIKLKWEHNVGSKIHCFTIDSLIRTDNDRKLILAFNGEPFNVDVKGEKEIEIPSINSFQLMKALVLQQPEQHVEIHFSDPLDGQQDFRGLVEIESAKKLKFTIEGNVLKVYPNNRITGSKEIKISSGILSVSSTKLQKSYTKGLTFEAIKPQISLIGKGVIVPNSNGLHFPFKTVNLSAVDVEIIKIFEDNVTQFLQVNQLDQDSEMRRVSRPVFKKTIELTSPNLIDYGQWNTFSIDLDEFIQNDPGAIYRVELSMKRAYSLYPCSEEAQSDEELEDNWDSIDEKEDSAWDGIETYYYDEDYNWYDRNNPCKSSYYKNKKVGRNVLASDLGIIAKSGNDKKVVVAVADLRTTEPLSDIEVEIYNYQQQLLGKQKTDKDGLCTIDLKQKPFLLIANKGKQKGYLKLDDGSSLSLSTFDVSGEKISKGIKGYMYGDRGVWRPGDTLFLNFILEDKQKVLPKNHPLSFELINPRGQTTKHMVKTQGVGDFYSFITTTDSDAPTGNWLARVKVGGATFEKSLRIETVKPNRLKIKIDFGKDKLTAQDNAVKGKLEVKWLHGAVARNLKAVIDVKLKSVKTRFKRYTDFVFDDPTQEFESEEYSLFEGEVDDNGLADFSSNLKIQSHAPGMLKATFLTRVFEEGGDFSIDQISLPYAPYKAFVGLKTPAGDKARGMLLTDENHKVSVVTVDANGNPIARKGIEVQVFKVSWRWWWQLGPDNLASYAGSSYHTPLISKTISTNSQGIGDFDFKIKYPDWGRYLIRVKDTDGHVSGKTVYVDWPGWAGRAQEDNPGGASMLMFGSDKKDYKVGETAKITFKGSKNGRALISLENGSKVLNSFWVQTQDEETVFDLKLTDKMAPTVYVSITLLQPHANTANDLPIRLYGTIPLNVEDPQTQLNPVLNMPDELSSEQDVTLKVKERDGNPMTYTIAMVDEGLLDLTRFETPNPWRNFYKREALGVKTWDIYNMVLGAYGGQIEQVFAIGGDEDLQGKGKKKADRFKPVVKFLGPFELDKNKTAEHHIKLPKYIGSVRTMVVAGKDNAYGSTDKATAVKSPLMLLATLPRVLSPFEEVKIPVTVFAMDEKLQDVSVKIECNDLLQVVDGSIKQIKFNRIGDQDIEFNLLVKENLGVAKVKIIAESGSEKAEYEMEVQVRIPNPKVTDIYSTIIQPGEMWKQEFIPVGINGTNTAILDLASIPPIDFGRRLKYLIDYPHGCVEQTTSSVFPQLYLDKVMEVDENVKEKLTTNIEAGINRLKSFQLADGGLSYWPGGDKSDAWGTCYAGHFMLEAEALGYQLPIGFKERWLEFQQREANNWQSDGKAHSQLIQAYRLYTIALAGEAEIGAMNRLRESNDLTNAGKWRLAAAYALAGKPEVTKEITSLLPGSIPSYKELSYTYGSSERDEAMILETLILLKDKQRMVPLIEKLSGELASKSWMSTQTTAYCLIAFSKLLQGDYAGSGDLNYTYRFNDQEKVEVNTDKKLKQHQVQLQSTDKGVVEIVNQSTTVMYATLAVEGIPLEGDKTASANGLTMKVDYKDLDDNLIKPESIVQGSDFKVEVSITNPGTLGDYKEMALTQLFPSGWEIHNSRMFDGKSTQQAEQFDYQDIRDDRVYTYFGLKAGKTKRFTILLNASYLGKFYMPTISCQAMYDNKISARTPGEWVLVVKSGK
ncbi:hypothetical protein EO244_01610 [Ancylomarina salipaludis]|uniref:Alpha-2-macroglobulin domain-containing protein n=1 Tax=Ancylomarina salipaludis TaxID=2501299 RepID=A0A4Q1JS41_9BACT|nr:MG2 domain-containing protein [Ancylomarina salipaludis]RXQ97605.1 hypothetical protein EO244_01610 [Ancylomarina salipaludis]